MIKKIIHQLFIIFALSQGLLAQTYSVSLKPGPGNAMDANVTSDSPDLNSSGTQTLRFSRSATGTVERAFIKFNLTDLPRGTDIISAKLTLHGVHHDTHNPGNGILQLVPDTWDYDAVTYNLSTLLQDASLPFKVLASPTVATQNYALDVADMVQTMVNTPLVNYGWMLYMEDESSINDKVFEFGAGTNDDENMRPTLDIVYCEHLIVNAYVSPSSDASTANAGVSLSVSKGVPPYTYVWSNSATGKDLYNIMPGLYDVTITDTRGIHTNVLVPVTSECGNITYSVTTNVSNYQGSYKSVLLSTESLNDNAARSNYGRPAELTAYNVSTGGAGISIGQTLLAFDMKALPNNLQVNSANLILTNTHAPYSAAFALQLARVQQDWDERTLTYGDNPTYNADLLQFDYDASQTTYNVDVTGHLQQMLAEVSSAKGWMLKLKSEGSDGVGEVASFGSSASLAGTQPMLVMQLTYANVFCDDTKLNWNQEDGFDESGNIIGSQKNYLDNLGRSTQQLVKNATNEVFRSQTLYDSYGNPALTTMAAYTGNQLKYQPGFMRNQSAQVYGLADFDLPATYNAPNLLETGVYNTLGNYYSDNNIYDANQATADNPFTRVKYSANPGGAAISSSKPGNAFKTGSGRESYSFSMTSGDELKYVFGSTSGTPATYYSYKVTRNPADYLDCSPITVSEPLIATKQIMITPDNVEMISYSAGGKVIATCYSGLSSGETCSNMTSVSNVMAYQGTQSTDLHLPDVNKSSLVLPLPSQPVAGATPSTGIVYTITDLYTDRLLVQGSDYTINSGQHVVFGPAFLAAYTGRSLMLRISFAYTPAYIAATLLAYYVAPTADALVNYSLSYGHFSKNYYDLGGSLRRGVSPKGFSCSSPASISMSTTYDYSHFGQLIAQKSPDQGLAEITYDTEGRARFTQNAEQKLNNRFSYVNYDKHGRPVETGENQSSTAGSGFSYSYWFSNYYGQNNNFSAYHTGSIIDQTDGLLATEKTNTTVTSYTTPASANDIPNTYSYYSQYRNFRNGQANFVKNNNSTVWLNYDAFGRSLATITQITEADFVAKQPNIDDQVKTSESTYNYFTGLTTTTDYQANNGHEKLEYQLTYDANYRPLLTTLNYGGTSEQLTSNAYNKMGQRNRVVLGNNYQGLDYVYTLNGGLKAINHPGLDATLDPGHDADIYAGANNGVNKDLFGEIIEYYHNDYERAGTSLGSSIASGSSLYNGLIYGVRFKTRDKVNAQVTGASYIDNGLTPTTLINTTNYQDQELRFSYAYDEFNRFGNSVFGTYNNASDVFTPRAEYSESGAGGGNVTYDRNGNITALQRAAYMSGGSLVMQDNLAYTNGSASNQLTGIVDAAVNSLGASNFATPSTSSPSAFTYNSIGQLVQSPAEKISSIDYFPDGKQKKIVFTNGNTSEYEYGAGGEKLKTLLYNATTSRHKYTWYVGPYIYEYDEAAPTPAFNMTEAKVIGGLLRVSSGTDVSIGYMVYQVADHLGNVRATFKGHGTDNGIDILSYNDYYAFGGQLPGRSWAAEDYRYGYQGQEKPQDGTLWDQFELRAYNHDLGRWFAPDPYGQFASPYIAMANNPVSNIDPDGGQVPLFDPAHPPLGMQERDRERADRSGAYSREEVNKRYMDEYNDLRLHYLGTDYGNRADIDGYMNAMGALNDFYGGMAQSFGWTGAAGTGYSSGLDYLTQAEIGGHQMSCWRTGSQASGMSMTGSEQLLIQSANTNVNLTEQFVVDNSQGRSASSEGDVAQTVNKIMSNGEPTGEVVVSTYYPDGSEVHTTFDSDGATKDENGVAHADITNVSYMSGEYADEKNNRAGNSSFNKDVDIANNIDALAQSGGGVPNDGGGKGSIAGLPDIAPNMFPDVGIEVNTLATITGRGYYDNKTKTLQLPIGAKTSYAQHEYGHYLQSQQMPASCYDALESASFWNAIFSSSREHENFWTEKDANYRSSQFFGPDAPISDSQIWPR